MARFLANSTACPLRGPGKARRSVKTMYCSQTPVLRIQSFSGLRVSIALDLTARPGQDLFLKVNLSVSSRKGKASLCVTRAMFDQFTTKAIKVIILSQEEARSLDRDFVGTEQILLGLIGEGTGIAARLLTSMGITLEDAREEVEKIIGRGIGVSPGEIPFTLLAKRALDFSLEEAGHDDDIGPEHLLLGLLRVRNGVAARIIENLGGDHSYIRTQVISIVRENNEFASYD